MTAPRHTCASCLCMDNGLDNSFTCIRCSKTLGRALWLPRNPVLATPNSPCPLTRTLAILDLLNFGLFATH